MSTLGHLQVGSKNLTCRVGNIVGTVGAHGDAVKADALHVLAGCEEFVREIEVRPGSCATHAWHGQHAMHVSTPCLLHGHAHSGQAPFNGGTTIGIHTHWAYYQSQEVRLLLSNSQTRAQTCALQTLADGDVWDYWHLNKELLKGEPKGISGGTYTPIA